jgi:hypothetical protein
MSKIEYAPEELLKPLDLEENELPKLKQEEDPDEEQPDICQPFKQFAKVIYWKGTRSIEVWKGVLTKGIYIDPELKLSFINSICGRVTYSFNTPVKVVTYKEDDHMAITFAIGIEPVKEEP